jgi:hypothetical protein
MLSYFATRSYKMLNATLRTDHYFGRLLKL